MGRLRRRAWRIAFAASLFAVATGTLIAQTSVGALAGKLTDLHSKPLDGVTVTLKNPSTGTEVRTLTGKGGGYHFSGIAPGTYEVEAASPQLGSGIAGGVEVFAGHESRVQTAVALTRELTPQGSRTVAEAASSTQSRPAVALIRREPVRSATPSDRDLTVTSHNQPAGEVRAADSSRKTPEPSLGNEATAPSLASSLVAPALPAGLPAALRVSPLAAGVAGRAPGALAAIVAVAVARAGIVSAERELAVGEASGSATVEVTLNGEQMEQLPLPGRRWENFVLDTPGQESDTDEVEVAQSGPARSQGAITVDGASTRMAFGGRVRGQAGAAFPAGPGGSETSIREFRLSNIEDAGSSAATGERVHLETRGGPGGFHGQGFFFNRQDLLGAQNPFTQWVKESAPGSLSTVPAFTAFPYSPADKENRWGAGAGGELGRHRLWWFASLDGNQRNHPAVATVKHPDQFFAQPSNDEMQVLSARLGLSGANPVAEGLQAYSGMLESLAGLLGPAPRTSQHWSGFGRLDWRTAERHRFVLEGSGAVWNSPGGGLSRAAETFGSHSFGVSQGSSEGVLSRWEARLSPNLWAVTQGSIRQVMVGARAEPPSPFEQGFAANVWGQLPQMTVDSRYGFTIGNPARFGPGSSPDERVYEAQASLDWARRTLQLRAGADLRHSGDATSLLRNHTGTYFYSSVENFVSDALVFAKFGLADALDPKQQHNCDQRGKAWRDTTGQLNGLGYLPCYSHYTQTLGPTQWYLSTNDWAAFVTTQWHPAKRLEMTAGVRWDREDTPPPIALVNNPALRLTQRLPALGSMGSPRLGLAWGQGESRWPVLRAGYGMYAGRTSNGTLETALTETGSLKGDLKFFMRPTDNLPENGGGAPPFPYVLGGEPAGTVKPGVVEFASNFHNAEIHQGVVELDQRMPGRILVSLGALVSLARRLPVTMDTNYDPAVNPKTITYAVVDSTGKGPLKKPQITVPFFASWPGADGTGGRLNTNYQQITEIDSRANSTYEAATVRASRYARRGLSFHARYTYGHAMDWNPNESSQVTRDSIFDPTNFALEYGTSNLDQRHTASAMAIWEAPWNRRGPDRWLTNGWMLSGTAQFHGGLPYTMRTAGSITREFELNGTTIAGLGPGMNGYGGADRVYGVGRNTYRYPRTWKADMRLGRKFGFGHGREMEFLVESFNLFNHQNVTEVESTGYSIEPGTISGSLPTLNFLTGLKTGQTEFGQPLNINAVDFYRERQFDLGLRMRF